MLTNNIEYHMMKCLNIKIIITLENGKLNIVLGENLITKDKKILTSLQIKYWCEFR